MNVGIPERANSDNPPSFQTGALGAVGVSGHVQGRNAD
jgi:hypothetical protein